MISGGGGALARAPLHPIHPDVPGMIACLAPEEFALGPLSVLPYRRFFERFESFLVPR